MSSNVCVIRFGARARACATVRQEPHNALQGTLWYSGHFSFMVPDGAWGEGGVKPGLVRLSAMKTTQGLPFPRVFYAPTKNHAMTMPVLFGFQMLFCSPTYVQAC